MIGETGRGAKWRWVEEEEEEEEDEVGVARDGGKVFRFEFEAVRAARLLLLACVLDECDPAMLVNDGDGCASDIGGNGGRT